MNLIPLIKTEAVKKQKEIATIYTRLNKDKKTVSSAYILDRNGIKNNHPCLSLHQYTHRWFDTIVDAGCRHVGDVVDTLLTGARIVVIRPDLWREPDLLSVRDISDSDLYIWCNPLRKNYECAVASVLFNQGDGIILFLDDSSSPLSFTVRDRIKRLISLQSNGKILVFDSQMSHEREIKSFGLDSIIVDEANIQDGRNE